MYLHIIKSIPLFLLLGEEELRIRSRERKTESGDSTPVSVSSGFDYEMGDLSQLPRELQELEQREITEMERCFETEEEDDGERTITKNVEATRESIVGFFQSTKN